MATIIVRIHFPDGTVDEFEVAEKTLIKELKQQITNRPAFVQCIYTRGNASNSFHLSNTGEKVSKILNDQTAIKSILQARAKFVKLYLLVGIQKGKKISKADRKSAGKGLLEPDDEGYDSVPEVEDIQSLIPDSPFEEERAELEEEPKHQEIDKESGKELGPTQQMNRDSKWIGVSLVDGVMIKIKYRDNETADSLKKSIMAQLNNFIEEVERNDLCLLLEGSTKKEEIVKLEEEVRLNDNPIISETIKNQQIPLLWSLYIPKTAETSTDSFSLMLSPPTASNKEKRQNMLINNVLNSSYVRQKQHYKPNDEVIKFRSKIFPIISDIQTKENLNKNYSQITDRRWPEFLNTPFPVCFYYSGLNNAKSFDCTPETRMSEIVTKYLQSSHISTIKSKTLADVYIKFCDINEYLHPEMLIGSVVLIREYLKKRKPIQFTIVERTNVDCSYNANDNYEEMYLPRLEGDLFKQLIPGEKDAALKSSSSSTDCYSSVFELDYNFQLRIIKIVNLKKYFPMYFDPSNTEPTQFLVEVSVYHGCTLLVTICTHYASSSSGLFDEWIGTPEIKLSQLPRAARACVTLYVKNPKEISPIGWVNFTLFDYENVLRYGALELPLWLNGKADPRGTCALNIESNPVVLCLELPYYSDNPVIYPSFSSILYRISDPSGVSVAQPLPRKLQQLIERDPMYHMSPREKELIWNNRILLMDTPEALPKVIQCADWTNPLTVEELLVLMSKWEKLKGVLALQLLDAYYPAPEVREYAVNCIREMPDVELADYLLQLIQVLKYEPYHDCPLSRFLLQRALQNREKIGHSFFWYLKSELSASNISERYTLLLEAYLLGCGGHLHELYKQTLLVDQLSGVSRLIKSRKKNRHLILQEQLAAIKIENKISLPIQSTMVVSEISVSKCKYMDSFTVPLWLVFKNLDPYGEAIKVLFKTGDDLRADILTLQVLRIMDKLWKDSELDLHLSTYICISTNIESGIIEVVPNAVTTASIQKVKGVVTGALKKTPLARWLREQNPAEIEYDQAVDNFVRSLAGYCVATYILGIGDRHNDNIMITTSGHLFHIDFSHFLGNVQTWQGIKRERAPFVLTPEFLYVMGKKKGTKFLSFRHYCCMAFNILRKHASLFISLFSMMLSTGIPELKTDSDIDYLRNAFVLHKTDAEAAEYFESLIESSLNTKTTQVNFLIHNLAQTYT